MISKISSSHRKILLGWVAVCGLQALLVARPAEAKWFYMYPDGSRVIYSGYQQILPHGLPPVRSWPYYGGHHGMYYGNAYLRPAWYGPGSYPAPTQSVTPLIIEWTDNGPVQRTWSPSTTPYANEAGVIEPQAVPPANDAQSPASPDAVDSAAPADDPFGAP